MYSTFTQYISAITNHYTSTNTDTQTNQQTGTNFGQSVSSPTHRPRRRTTGLRAETRFRVLLYTCTQDDWRHSALERLEEQLQIEEWFG
ncbi:unnamed protein product [Protopolystoma xenopodis]|uniref:Uncharacterized protein n=1 Tax=Protopolystoma xenopodis TaxID=117903 RepID=A0A448WIQ9_9PLAT|nr:unnamed protein product [Protopolystoma xenopodis]